MVFWVWWCFKANKWLIDTCFFSILLRFTLEVTKSEMISLEDELGYLNSYVELQNMRLENVIDFMIYGDSTVDVTQCFSRTMMLYTLAENAIIHWLLTLETNVSFFWKSSEWNFFWFWKLKIMVSVEKSRLFWERIKKAKFISLLQIK